jgi:hypothetical protein
VGGASHGAREHRETLRRRRPEGGENESLATRIGERLKKAETSAETKLEKLDPAMKKRAEQRPSRAKVYAEYAKALGLTAPIASSGDTAMRMVSDLFSGQAALAEDKSPFNQAYTQYLALKNMMKEDDYGDSDFLWALVGGPLNYLVDYGVAKTSCSLQDRWEGDVIRKMDGVPKDKVLKSLFDKTDGVVVKYRDDTAKPFLVQARVGYHTEEGLREHAVPAQHTLQAGFPEIPQRGSFVAGGVPVGPRRAHPDGAHRGQHRGHSETAGKHPVAAVRRWNGGAQQL